MDCSWWASKMISRWSQWEVSWRALLRTDVASPLNDFCSALIMWTKAIPLTMQANGAGKWSMEIAFFCKDLARADLLVFLMTPSVANGHASGPIRCLRTSGVSNCRVCATRNIFLKRWSVVLTSDSFHKHLSFCFFWQWTHRVLKNIGRV